MYYPLSQIQTNLYTNGNELIVASTKIAYSGYYWKTSKGEYFSGKTPQDLPSQKLVLSNTQPEASPANVNASTTTVPSIYSILKLSQPKIIINSYFPQPTQDEYNAGEFVRYFYKKVNELIYMEINKDDYFNLANRNPQYDYALYVPFYTHWQLTGNKEQVYNTNKNMVQLTMQRQSLYQFDKFLKEDYLKFYK
jgi:hypothetical protein